MQDIQHINFSNSPRFAAQPGAHIAKAIEIYHQLNADEVEHFDRTGLLPAAKISAAENIGFDAFTLSANIRNIHNEL